MKVRERTEGVRWKVEGGEFPFILSVFINIISSIIIFVNLPLLLLIYLKKKEKNREKEEKEEKKKKEKKERLRMK